MAAVSEDQVLIEPESGRVEKRVVVRPVKDRTAPFALALTLLFIVTCVFVFFGERMGMQTAGPTPAATTTTAQ